MTFKLKLLNGLDPATSVGLPRDLSILKESS